MRKSYIDKMKVALVSSLLSSEFNKIEEFEEKLFLFIKDEVDKNTQIIIFPECFLFSLTKFFEGSISHKFKEVSLYTEILKNKLEEILKEKKIFLVLGSGPFYEGQKLFNSSFIWNKRAWYRQDKTHLTPFENIFLPGDSIHIFTFNELKISVLICFDIEQPHLASFLKKEGVDLILCPSATSSKMGNDRINRCASSRSVELGALVMTIPLIGESKLPFLLHNEGRQGIFLPPQEVTSNLPLELFSDYSVNQKIISYYEFDSGLFSKLKSANKETKAYLSEEREVHLIHH